MMPEQFNYGRYIYPSTAKSWWQVASVVEHDGQQVQPRKLPSRELLNCHLQFNKPRFNYINPKGRKLNLPFAIVELCDFMMGLNPGNGIYYNSQMSKFINTKTGKFDGGYGSRFYPGGFNSSFEENQLFRALSILVKDPDSRQAVVTIHNNVMEKWGGLDVACTLSLQFLIRNGQLHMITTMRSEDVYLGFCYDTFEFQLMQQCMASLLKVETGKYFHNVGSLHLYESDIEKLHKVDPLVIPYSDEIGLPIIEFENYYEMINEFAAISEMAKRINDFSEQDNMNDVMEMPHHLSCPYMVEAAKVVSTEILRRHNKSKAAQELSREIRGEFANYFRDRYGWD